MQTRAKLNTFRWKRPVRAWRASLPGHDHREHSVLSSQRILSAGRGSAGRGLTASDIHGHKRRQRSIKASPAQKGRGGRGAPLYRGPCALRHDPGRAGFDRIRHSRSQEKAALNPSGALLYRWSLRNTTRSSRDRPRETSSLTREDSTLSSQRIFLLGRIWPHQTFTVTSEGSAHALPFLPYLLMVALHHDMIIQTSSQENSTLSVHSAPSAFMPVQRGTGFTPQRSGFAS